MSEPIDAIYENGVFKPLEVLNLPEHQPVRLTIESAQTESAQNESAQNEYVTPLDKDPSDPLAGIRETTGIPDLAGNFDDYRFGKRHP